MPSALVDWSILCSLLFHGVRTTTNLAKQIFPLHSMAEETEPGEEIGPSETHCWAAACRPASPIIAQPQD